MNAIISARQLADDGRRGICIIPQVRGREHGIRKALGVLKTPERGFQER